MYGEADEARRGEALLLLASLAKAKHQPGSYMSADNGGSPRLMAISANQIKLRLNLILNQPSQIN